MLVKRTFEMNCIISLFFCFCWGQMVNGQTKEMNLNSPDGRMVVNLSLDEKLSYDLLHDGNLLLENCGLQLNLRGEELGNNPKLTKQKTFVVDEKLTPVVPLKYSVVRDHYNGYLLDFKGDYSVEFRIYDDGVAYRFITRKKGDIDVMGEDILFNFPTSYLAHMQEPGSFKTAYEEPYTHKETQEWTSMDKIAVLPLLLDTKKRV